MEEITLRSYQKELIKETRTGLKLHNRVINSKSVSAFSRTIATHLHFSWTNLGDLVYD